MRNSNNPGKARVDLTDPYVSAGADIQRDSRQGPKIATSSGASEARTPRDLTIPKDKRSNAKLLAQQYVDNDGETKSKIDNFMQAYKLSPPGEQFFMPRYNMDNPQNA